MRGFAQFALKEYDDALADLLEARNRRPGLVGLNEPIAALAKLTKTPAPIPVEEPDGVRSGRASLLTFSRILWTAAGKSKKQSAPPNLLFDFRSRAQEVDAMIRLNPLGRPQVNVGDVLDFAKCGMSAQIALMELLPSSRPGDGTIPSAEEIRGAFGYCLVFLAGTQSINAMSDPAFSEMVQGFRDAVDALNAKLDEFKFDLP